MKILITGAAGFIGFHLVNALCGKGYEVVGIDNINDYYPVSLKYARLAENGIDETQIVQGKEVQSSKYANYRFCRIDITDNAALEALFDKNDFDIVMNLAAQAGVRYSIENPYAYIQSNVVGFLNLLECARRNKTSHFIYASSSSVYGGNSKTPFSEDDRVDNQVSVYAATKRSNELIANVYSKLYGLATTGLRFFTVYGPWGRPDMAPMLFAKSIIEGNPIKVFNGGNLSRDFTYIDDIIHGILCVIESSPKCADKTAVYNIGHGSPVNLMDFIDIMEHSLGCKAKKQMCEMQPGDVYITYADTTALAKDYGYNPQTSLQEGVMSFIKWYKEYTGR